MRALKRERKGDQLSTISEKGGGQVRLPGLSKHALVINLKKGKEIAFFPKGITKEAPALATGKTFSWISENHKKRGGK